MLRAGFGLLCLIAASAAAASDMLPLKRGIYVDLRVPCKGASNADTLSYWGGSNGLNEARIKCAIKHMSKKGDAYVLERKCMAISFSGTFEDGVTVKVLSRTSFVLSGGHRLAEPDRRYRYCGPKVQF
jgi:hypothetical protein